MASVTLEVSSGSKAVPVHLSYRPWTSRLDEWKEGRLGTCGCWEVNRPAGKVHLLRRAEGCHSARLEIVLSLTWPASQAGSPFSKGDSGWARVGACGFAGFFNSGDWVRWRVTGTSLW